jgi:hypothetical protein
MPESPRTAAAEHTKENAASKENHISHQKVVSVIDPIAYSQSSKENGLVIRVDLDRISLRIVEVMGVSILYAICVVLLEVWVRLSGIDESGRVF